MALFDAVYPLGTGSRIGNEEIRFSLRSLEKHADRLGRVFVIGEKPDFLNWGEDLIHIPYKEKHSAPRNIWEKLFKIGNDERISERFIWMNDDFYILKDFDAGEIPYYSRGGRIGLSRADAGKKIDELDLTQIERGYNRMLKHTCIALEVRKLTTYHYATHQPINFDRFRVRQCYATFARELQAKHGLSFRCCYGNLYNLPRIVRPTKIVKDDWTTPKGRLAFASHRDVSQAELRENLSQMFPEPSRFETNR